MSTGLRVSLAVMGLLTAQAPYWLSGPLSDVNAFVVVLAVLAVVPFVVYVKAVRTTVGSVVGGLALLAFPTVAYFDYFFDREAGFNFAPVTVPLINVVVLVAVLGLDRVWLQRHSGRHRERKRTVTLR